MKYSLDADYWQGRYERGKTGWDLGHLSRPLRTIIDGLDNKELKVLVPGAGNAFEVEYLWGKGFRNTHLLDWAEQPLANFMERNPEFPREQVLRMDFFDLEGAYDLILEQTFFCSLPPRQRKRYVEKTHQLLKKQGRIKGVLFNVPLYSDRPPFGGSSAEYQPLFSEFFELIKMEDCSSSEPDRQGMEIEIELMPK